MNKPWLYLIIAGMAVLLAGCTVAEPRADTDTYECTYWCVSYEAIQKGWVNLHRDQWSFYDDPVDPGKIDIEKEIGRNNFTALPGFTYVQYADTPCLDFAIDTYDDGGGNAVKVMCMRTAMRKL